jgi:hypothetical protein
MVVFGRQVTGVHVFCHKTQVIAALNTLLGSNDFPGKISAALEHPRWFHVEKEAAVRGHSRLARSHEVPQAWPMLVCWDTNLTTA